MTIQTRPVVTREDYPSREECPGERDRLLVEAHLHHDADAFAIIVDDHWDALICQARRILGPNGGAAEDVVQETFERALKYLPRFGRTGEYKLGAWLHQILRSVIQNYWERTAREARSAQRSANERDFEVDVADRVGDPVVAQALQRRIRGLPESQRAAFVMREVVGLPYADVARALNVSEENVRARVSRSKDRLRRSSEGLRSAVGGLIAAPFGWRLFHREKSSIGRTGDQVAVQISSSPISQTVLSLATVSVPRGSLLFGIAATVATIGTGTALLATSAPNATGPSTHAAATDPVSGTTPSGATSAAPAPALAAAQGANTPAGGSSSSSSNGSYGWVNAGTGSSAPVVTTGLPAATCASIQAPATVGWTGPALGLSNALSVAIGSTVDLPTVGSTVSYSSVASVQPFGQQGAGESVVVVTNACVSSSGQWFSATVSGIGGPFQLAGSLVQVLGSGDETSYIFRGSIPASAVLPGALEGAIQFVADLSVTEPANTAQLTIVFLGANVQGAAATPVSSNSPATSAASPAASTTSASSTEAVTMPAVNDDNATAPTEPGTASAASVSASQIAAAISNAVSSQVTGIRSIAGLGSSNPTNPPTAGGAPAPATP